jgi:hypothetical protein
MEGNSTGSKALRCVLKSVQLASAWAVHFVRTRFLSYKHCKAKQNLDRRMSRLGTEIYSLYKQGDTEFLKSLVVRQQLKIVEEAESQLFSVLDRMEALDNAYRTRKDEIAGAGQNPE